MNYIVAVDKNWGIGKNNDLLFSLRGDMKFFKETTMGSTVVMGDRTLLSLPKSEPLKGRDNVVMTLDENFKPDGVTLCHSIEDLGKYLKETNPEKVFVMGGATIYNLLYDYCEYAYITKVDAVGDADVFIKNLDTLDHWEMVEEGETLEENGLKYRFCKYKNNQIKEM